MKYKISLCISALCFFTAFLILMASRTTGEEALASRIAPEILRFHVLAESDSTRDQNLKLGVKGLVWTTSTARFLRIRTRSSLNSG